MQLSKIALAAVAAIALAGCQWNDMQRAGAGAAAGAVVAKATNGNLLTGALIGAGAGAICDDINLELCN